MKGMSNVSKIDRYEVATNQRFYSVLIKLGNYFNRLKPRRNYLPPALIIRNSAFCPHTGNLFMVSYDYQNKQ
jgi:hypothetical protein